MTQLGEELRRERMRRGLTYKDVEQRLHIRSAYLEALEEGNYDVIPGQVYTKGFIHLLMLIKLYVILWHMHL